MNLLAYAVQKLDAPYYAQYEKRNNQQVSGGRAEALRASRGAGFEEKPLSASANVGETTCASVGYANENKRSSLLA